MANNPAPERCPKCESDNVDCSEVMQDNPHREWMQVQCHDCQHEGSEFPFDVEADEEFQAKRDAIAEWNAMPCKAHPSQAAGGAEEAARAVKALLSYAHGAVTEVEIQAAAAIIQKAIDAALQAKPDMTFTDDDILDAHTQGMQDGRGMKAKPDSGCLPVAQVVIIERQTAIAAMRAIMDAFYDADLNRAEKVYRAYLAKAPAAPAHKEGE